MMASCGRSKSTSAGRILPDAPRSERKLANVNLAEHFLSARVVDGVLGRVVTEKLLVSRRTPFRVAAILVGQNDDPGFASLGQLIRDLSRDWEDGRAAQFCGKLDGIHDPTVTLHGR